MYSVLNITADTLHCGNIGHAITDFSSACRIANKYGFQGVNVDLSDMLTESADKIFKDLASNQLRAASFGIPVKFFSPDAEYFESIDTFESVAELAAKINCRVALCYLPPFSEDLNFNDLFERTVSRIEKIKPILFENNIKIGFEFIGPTETRTDTKYDFIHTIDGTRALIAASGIYGFGGFKLDSHHWQNSGASLLDIKHLDLSYLLYLELNDGLPDYTIHDMPEFERELPLTTHITDNIGLLDALRQKGYKGPVAIEPWNEQIRQMPVEEAIRKVKQSLDVCFEQAGLRANKGKGQD